MLSMLKSKCLEISIDFAASFKFHGPQSHLTCNLGRGRTLTFDFFAQTPLFLIQALELRDDDKKRLLGKGMGLGGSQAVSRS